MGKYLICIFIVLAFGCQQSLTSDHYDYGNEFVLMIGEEARVGEGNSLVMFEDVLEDSRCPADVTCVWVGNAKIKIQFINNTIKLNTYLAPQDTVISNHKITLLDLDPYPETSWPFEREDYTVRLLITEE